MPRQHDEKRKLLNEGIYKTAIVVFSYSLDIPEHILYGMLAVAAQSKSLTYQENGLRVTLQPAGLAHDINSAAHLTSHIGKRWDSAMLFESDWQGYYPVVSQGVVIGLFDCALDHRGSYGRKPVIDDSYIDADAPDMKEEEEGPGPDHEAP